MSTLAKYGYTDAHCEQAVVAMLSGYEVSPGLRAAVDAWLETKTVRQPSLRLTLAGMIRARADELVAVAQAVVEWAGAGEGSAASAQLDAIIDEFEFLRTLMRALVEN